MAFLLLSMLENRTAVLEICFPKWLVLALLRGLVFLLC